jgi:flagellar hook-length control protein FliK
MPGSAPPSVAESGDGQPVDGNALPSATLQDAAQTLQKESLPANDPVLEASLLSAVAQGVPAANGATGQTLAGGTMAAPQAAALMTGKGTEQPGLPPLTTPQQSIENAMPAQAVKNVDMPPALLNMQMNSQATSPAPQNSSPGLANTIQDMQRATASPAIPAMLGKPISMAAQQALARAGLNTGKAHALREGSMPSGVSAALHAQAGLSGVSTGLNYSAASTARMDMFAAAMNAATQKEAQAELRLPVNSATAMISAPLVATGEIADESFNAAAALSRAPGTATSPVLHTLPLSTPVSHSSWASELGQRVTWMANNELREAQLQLHPRSLGTVEVRVAFGHEQQLNISFSAANPIARDALDASLPRLREMLEQQGLQLGDADISHEPPSEREQQKYVNNESFANDEGHLLNGPLGEVIGGGSPTPQWVGEGMLDAYA